MRTLRRFLTENHPEEFYLWNEYNIKFCNEITKVFRKGGELNIFMPRGKGTTSILKYLTLWIANDYEYCIAFDFIIKESTSYDPEGSIIYIKCNNKNQ